MHPRHKHTSLKDPVNVQHLHPLGDYGSERSLVWPAGQQKKLQKCNKQLQKGNIPKSYKIVTKQLQNSNKRLQKCNISKKLLFIAKEAKSTAAAKGYKGVTKSNTTATDSVALCTKTAQQNMHKHSTLHNIIHKNKEIQSAIDTMEKQRHC